ncbi:MAG: WGR domain-containing protein [Myxococcota bacterium]|nr:WGR domain-containing protein [Myxococcota bacterium]
MQRFELEGNKFWEVRVKDAGLLTRWGKIGTNGEVKAQTFANPAAARAARDKLVAEKRAKGYREIKVPKAPKQTQDRVIVPVALQQPRASGTIDPDELVVKELRTGGGRAGRILIDGKRVLVTGEQCLVSSNGERFHRRRSPGESWCLFKHGDAIYSLADSYKVSRDFGVSWKDLSIPDDPYYKFCIYRDSKGTFWMGADEGKLFTSDSLEGTWKPSKLEGTGKILDIIEVDGRMLFMGYGSHGFDGTNLKRLKGIDKEHIICRVTQAPSGTLIAVGDSGVVYRSTDRGVSWTFVKSGVRDDLEDIAWVAGALFAVGGDGAILKTTDDGETWTKIDSNTDQHLWGIESWGDGAFIGGEYGLIVSLASPDDSYWANTTDDFAPPPPTIDASFEPQRAAVAAERERMFTELTAQAVVEHDRICVKSGLSRPRDANPRLAKMVEEAADDDPIAAQVYADWLQGEGDPRGELAAIQLQRANLGKSKDLKKAERELLAQHADRFLGKLVRAQSFTKLKWRAGFIYSARIANAHDNDDDKKVAMEDVVSWLLDEPSARFLRKLSVGIVTFFENDYEAVAERISQRYLPSLRELFLGDFDEEDTELSWSNLGDIEAIYPSLPNLKSLRLRSGSMTLGKIVLPRLESFTVETGGLDHDAAQAIASAKWPGLKSLSLQIGSDEYGGDATIDDLRPILEGVGLPRLEHLGIKNCEITEELVEPLATSRILPQLKSIDLGMGTMGDDGAKMMFRFQKAFAHLEKIDLQDNFITREGSRLLKSTNLEVKIGEQRDDEGDPDNRYASAAE